MNRASRKAVRALLIAATLGACTEPPDGRAPDNTPIDTAAVLHEVEAAVWAFHAADTARNADAVIALLWPEFEMLADGNRVGYQEAVAGSRGFMSGLEVFATDWTDVRIIPLGPDHAVASFQFRDSILTKTGDLIQAEGPTTFVFEQSDGGGS